MGEADHSQLQATGTFQPPPHGTAVCWVLWRGKITKRDWVKVKYVCEQELITSSHRNIHTHPRPPAQAFTFSHTHIYLRIDHLLSWLTSTGSLGPGSRWLQKGVALASELLAAGGWPTVPRRLRGAGPSSSELTSRASPAGSSLRLVGQGPGGPGPGGVCSGLCPLAVPGDSLGQGLPPLPTPATGLLPPICARLCKSVSNVCS